MTSAPLTLSNAGSTLNFMGPSDADPPAVPAVEEGAGQFRSSEAEAAQVEGAPFPPFEPRRLGQEGDVVPRVPTSPTAPPPDSGDASRTENGRAD